MTAPQLTQEHLKELLLYNPQTGVFTWRVHRGGKATAGSVAGSKDTHGYVQILVHKHPHRAHRLAWLYMTGDWPKDSIDHRNRIRSDNRWANLRDVTPAINAENTSVARSRVGRMLGTMYHSHLKLNPWEARITVKGRREYLGHYKTVEEAHAAYMEAKIKFHEGFSI
jgi:hypothetical protein